MNGAGAFLMDYLNQQRQMKLDARASDAFFKDNPAALTEMNIHPDEYKNYSAEDKVATRVGYLSAQQAKNQALMNQARADELGATAATRRQQMDEDTAAGQFVNSFINYPGTQSRPSFDPTSLLNYGRGPIQSAPPPPAYASDPLDVRSLLSYGQTSTPQPPMTQAQSMTPQDMLARWQYAAQNTPGYARHMDRIVGTLTKWQEAIEGGGGKGQFFKSTDQPQSFDGGWTRIPTGPNTSQLVYIDPDRGQIVPQHDQDGNLIGFSRTDPRGHSMFTPYKGNAQMKQMQDQDGNLMPNVYLDSQGKAHDFRTLMQKTMGDGGGAPAAAPAAKPDKTTGPRTVTTQTQFDALPSGSIYIGKDGKQYRKP